MTVRVNKDSFNLREKLSELERPIGLKGSELMGAETAQEARDFVSAGRKNMIINGACTINQRFGSGTYNLASSGIYFPVDRFKSWAGGTGAFTIQRSDNAPPGFKNSMMFTVSTADTSIASTEYYTVQQRIEGYNVAHLGWGTSDAKPVTLSFWVKGDIPGKYGISFWPSGQNYNYVTHYNINTADTWEYKTITIPGATGGTWLTDTGIGFGIWWDFGVGTTYSTATTETWGPSAKFAPSDSLKMIKTNGAKFRMTGVQLEVGKNATDFEHRSYGEELALCQRYYETTYPTGYGEGHDFNEVYPFANSHPVAFNFIASDDTISAQSYTFQVSKRANPTVRLFSAKNGTLNQAWTYKGTGGNNSNHGIAVVNTSPTHVLISTSLGATNQANESYFHIVAESEL